MRHSTDVGTIASTDAVDLDRDGSLSRADAFRRLADGHIEGAYRLARVILGDAAEAEDATHDAFVTAWRKWSSLRDPALFEHWFDRILVNTCRNRLRHKARWQSHQLSPDVWPAPDAFGQIHDRDALGPAIAGLSPDHRLVVALRFYRDLTVGEIASRLGVRPGTVKSRLHYALKHLHLELHRAESRRTLQ